MHSSSGATPLNDLDTQAAGDPNPLSLETSIGAAVRALRLRDGLTIAQVAEKADISRGMLSKIETGQTSAGMDTLARIARALGVSMSMLFANYDAAGSLAQHVKTRQ